MNEISAQLHSHLEGLASPFLFVGAGLSRRYAGTESWSELLQHFAAEAGSPYEYFLSRADGDLPRTASEIAEVFHPLWWSETAYEGSRTDWSGHATSKSSPLKIEVARRYATVHESLPTDGDLAEELRLLRLAVVDGVITTNYDLIMESIFPDFEVLVGQDEMLFANPQGVGEIYKVHGSCSNPNTLVLTGEDYDRFDKRNPYLAAKLLAVFVEHPVIFLGYSLDDSNVRRILGSIAGCLTQENVGELTDRLIFVRWAPGEPAGIASHTLTLGDFILTVKQVVVPDFLGVFDALTQLKRAFPAQILRRLKEHVYELVQSDDPKSQLVVADIDGDHGEDVEVVFGVGLKQRLGQTGYVGLDRYALIEDVLSKGEVYDAAEIVTNVLPKLVAGNTYAPVFKYLRGAGLLTKSGSIRAKADVDDRVRAKAIKIAEGTPASSHYAKLADGVLKGIAGVAELCSQHGEDGVFNYGLSLPPSKIDLDELREFLRATEDRLDSWTRTQWVKLVCMLDWLENGKAT